MGRTWPRSSRGSGASFPSWRRSGRRGCSAPASGTRFPPDRALALGLPGDEAGWADLAALRFDPAGLADALRKLRAGPVLAGG